MRHHFTEVMAVVQEQMADIAQAQKKRAELTATAAAADGLVEVTVNAAGQLMKTVIDESYLDEHEFDELADHITEASQAAAREASRRVAEIMAPISERRKGLHSLSQVMEGAPDLRDLAPSWLDPFAPAQPPGTPDDNGSDETTFPTVRR